MKPILVNYGMPSKKYILPMPEGSVTTNKKDTKSAVSKFGYFFKTAIKEIKEATFPLVNFAWKSRDDKCVHTNKHFVMSYV